jgi:hypothetical protein
MMVWWKRRRNRWLVGVVTTASILLAASLTASTNFLLGISTGSSVSSSRSFSTSLNYADADDSSIDHTIFQKCQRQKHPIFVDHFQRTPNRLDDFLQQQGNSTTTILMLGDSLDRNMIHAICELWQGRETFLVPRLHPHICYKQNGGGLLRIVYLNIFGMLRPCGAAEQLDPRPYNTTVERIIAWWPRIQQGLARVSATATTGTGTTMTPAPRIDFVSIGSSHWDLSEGCNDHPVIADSYRRDYQQGMQLLVETLFTLILESNPSVPILWRTAPPVSPDYSQYAHAHGRGRIHENQIALNTILKDAVLGKGGVAAAATNNINNHRIVDWWKVVTDAVPLAWLNRDELATDGRHYSSCSSLAFFNAVLDGFYSQLNE